MNSNPTPNNMSLNIYIGENVFDAASSSFATANDFTFEKLLELKPPGHYDIVYYDLYGDRVTLTNAKQFHKMKDLMTEVGANMITLTFVKSEKKASNKRKQNRGHRRLKGPMVEGSANFSGDFTAATLQNGYAGAEGGLRKTKEFSKNLKSICCFDVGNLSKTYPVSFNVSKIHVKKLGSDKFDFFFTGPEGYQRVGMPTDGYELSQINAEPNKCIWQTPNQQTGLVFIMVFDTEEEARNMCKRLTKKEEKMKTNTKGGERKNKKGGRNRKSQKVGIEEPIDDGVSEDANCTRKTSPVQEATPESVVDKLHELDLDKKSMYEFRKVLKSLRKINLLDSEYAPLELLTLSTILVKRDSGKLRTTCTGQAADNSQVEFPIDEYMPIHSATEPTKCVWTHKNHGQGDTFLMEFGNAEDAEEFEKYTLLKDE